MDVRNNKRRNVLTHARVNQRRVCFCVGGRGGVKIWASTGGGGWGREGINRKDPRQVIKWVREPSEVTHSSKGSVSINSPTSSYPGFDTQQISCLSFNDKVSQNFQYELFFKFGHVYQATDRGEVIKNLILFLAFISRPTLCYTACLVLGSLIYAIFGAKFFGFVDIFTKFLPFSTCGLRIIFICCKLFSSPLSGWYPDALQLALVTALV